jgi:heterotetrameric sarcosine oxidase gamma subunit
VAEPIARSPIAPLAPVVVRDGWEVSDRHSSAALTLADCTAMSKLVVRGTGALPVPFGRAERDGGTLVVGSGPGEWTVLGDDSPPEPDGDFVSVIDVTHGRALMRLTGARAASLLAKLCAIDFSERVTPNGAAFRSSVAKLVTDVARDDRDGRPSYLVHCERSSGQYLFDALLDAGAEFGIEPTGGDLR